MKTITLGAVLLLCSLHSFSQAPKENGIIYITDPHIDAVNRSNDAYMAKDAVANAKFFADTAQIWVSGMDKPMPIADALKMWASDFDYYDSIKVTPVGYPDYLHYKDQDQKFVQSWWVWSGKAKKSGKTTKVSFVQFDHFNTADKIDGESLYGDFSKMQKE